MNGELIERAKKRAADDIGFLKTHLGYVRAGAPHYYFPFGRDGIITAWQLLPLDPTIARTTLAFCAELQGREVNPKKEEEPGKIFHELRLFTDSRERKVCISERHHHPWPGVSFPYYGSVDATPLFIFLGGEYLRQTGDKEFIRELWDNFAAAYEWMVSYGDKDCDGFVEYARLNPNGLFHQGWRDCGTDHLKINPPVAIVEVQGYVYAAYNAFREMSEALGRYHETRSLSFRKMFNRRTRSFYRSFHERFWWPEEQYFYLALDGKKIAKRSVSSSQGHLLFTGILTRKRAHQVIERLMKPDIFTPYGIRTVSELDAYNPSSYHLGSIWPHDNWIIYEGCKRNGFFKEARAIKLALLASFEKLNCIPELFGFDGKEIYMLKLGERGCTYPANPVQAWAAGAFLNMLNDGV